MARPNNPSVCGKKVVIEKIDQQSPIKAEGWIEPSLAAKKMEVLARNGIDLPSEPP
jgi:hypothetical protein